MKLRPLVTLITIFPMTVAYASFEQQCNLQVAPEGATVTPSHGVDFISYPAEQPADYTGCSYMWLEDGTKLFASYYSKGDLVWLRGKEPKAKEESICFYEAGKLVEAKSKNIGRCPAP